MQDEIFEIHGERWRVVQRDYAECYVTLRAVHAPDLTMEITEESMEAMLRSGAARHIGPPSVRIGIDNSSFQADFKRVQRAFERGDLGSWNTLMSRSIVDRVDRRVDRLQRQFAPPPLEQGWHVEYVKEVFEPYHEEQRYALPAESEAEARLLGDYIIDDDLGEPCMLRLGARVVARWGEGGWVGA